MKFCILRSGSSGNCTYIEHRDTRILLDAGGMSCKRLIAVLGEIGIEPQTISAVVGTHIHSDHINRSTLSFCRTYRAVLHLNQQNNAALISRFDNKCRNGIDIRYFDHLCPFDIGPVRFEPFEVSHDAEGVTSGFRFYATDLPDAAAIGYAADLGHAPEDVIRSLKDCTFLCLEANHDTDLLWNNPRRTYLHKVRVTGERGHLSNSQSAEAISRLIEASGQPPRIVVLCHLSGDHNTPELAIEQVCGILGEKMGEIKLVIAQRHEKTPFFGTDENSTSAWGTSQLSLFDAEVV